MLAHSPFLKKFRSKNTVYFFFILLCIGLVAFNILHSQKYNKNMYGVMENSKDATITYLSHIWGTELFSLEIERIRAEGREDIMQGWEEVRATNNKRTQSLEDASLIHPYSPELYYNLYLLYKENGDIKKSTENLRKAQEIDPSIK